MERAGESEVQWEHSVCVGVCAPAQTFLYHIWVSEGSISLSRNCTCTQTEVSSAEPQHCLFEQIRAFWIKT